MSWHNPRMAPTLNSTKTMLRKDVIPDGGGGGMHIELRSSILGCGRVSDCWRFRRLAGRRRRDGRGAGAVWEAAATSLRGPLGHSRVGDVVDDDPPLVPLTVVGVWPSEDVPRRVDEERRETEVQDERPPAEMNMVVCRGAHAHGPSIGERRRPASDADGASGPLSRRRGRRRGSCEPSCATRTRGLPRVREGRARLRAVAVFGLRRDADHRILLQAAGLLPNVWR